MLHGQIVLRAVTMVLDFPPFCGFWIDMGLCAMNHRCEGWRRTLFPLVPNATIKPFDSSARNLLIAKVASDDLCGLRAVFRERRWREEWLGESGNGVEWGCGYAISVRKITQESL